MSGEKKQRLETRTHNTTSSSNPLAFENGVRLEMVEWDKRERVIQGMAIDNKRRFMYLLEHVSGRGLGIEQFTLVTPHEVLSTIREVGPLESFPPGILPMVAAYAGHWARLTWQRFVSYIEESGDSGADPGVWEKCEVDESHTGDVICSFNDSITLVRVTPTGYLRLIRHEEEKKDHEQIVVATRWSMLTTPTSCELMMADKCLGGFGIYPVEWKDERGTYTAKHSLGMVPLGTSSFLMDTCSIYTASSTHISRFLRDHGPLVIGSELILYEADTKTPIPESIEIAWCGPRHLLFATHQPLGRQGFRFSVFVLPLQRTLDPSVSPHLVATDIIRDPSYTDEEFHSVQFGLLTSPGSAQSHVLIRCESDFRIFPLPFPVL